MGPSAEKRAASACATSLWSNEVTGSWNICSGGARRVVAMSKVGDKAQQWLERTIGSSDTSKHAIRVSERRCGG